MTLSGIGGWARNERRIARMVPAGAKFQLRKASLTTKLRDRPGIGARGYSGNGVIRAKGLFLPWGCSYLGVQGASAEGRH
jgi:hypothetical protein